MESSDGEKFLQESLCSVKKKVNMEIWNYNTSFKKLD